MSKKTDTGEGQTFQGTITLTADPDPANYGYGDLEMQGTLFVDNINENTGNIGVNLENTVFNDSYFTMLNISQPPLPSVGNFSYYQNQANNGLFSSVDAVGTVTTYQPTNTRGDIQTHNGTTQIKLPVGPNTYVLSADSTKIEGIKWGVSALVGSSQSKGFTIQGVGSTNSTFIINYYYGSYFVLVYPFARYGSSCAFFVSKPYPNISGVSARLCSNPSALTFGNLFTLWNNYEELQIYKDYTEANGNYYTGDNSNYTPQPGVTLLGTNWVSLGSKYNVTTGAFCISIYSDNAGPSANFLIAKSVATLGAPAIITLTSGPSSLGSKLQLRWLANTGIEISKNSSSDDGLYNVVDSFQDNKVTSVTLSGTASSQISMNAFRFYENKTILVRISNNSLVSSPKIISIISKNTNTLSGVNYTLSAPGATTNEILALTWPSTSLLNVNKTGTNYDGVYTVDISVYE